MIEVKNQFVRHSLIWLWVIPLALFLLMPAFVGREEMRVPRDEVKMLSLLGQDAAQVTRRADEIYENWFVKTGLVSKAKRVFLTNLNENDPKFFKNLAKDTLTYHENMWDMIYRAIWRLTGLWPTLTALLLALVLPALVDGLVVRAKKVDVFESHNPVFFWSAGHAVVMVVGTFLLLPLLPYTISIFVLYGSIGLVTAAMWIAAANLQTGA